MSTCSKCPDCGAEVYKVVTEWGYAMLIDAEPVELGDIRLSDPVGLDPRPVARYWGNVPNFDTFPEMYIDPDEPLFVAHRITCKARDRRWKSRPKRCERASLPLNKVKGVANG